MIASRSDAAIRRAGKPIALYRVVLKANAVETDAVLAQAAKLADPPVPSWPLEYRYTAGL